MIYIEGQGVLVDHIRYLLVKINKSKSWRSNSVQAIRIFMDFMSANRDNYESATEAFKGFVDACIFGTVDENGEDDTGLYWLGRSKQRVSVLIQHLTEYTDYLADAKDDEDLRLNPFREATKYEQLIKLASYYHRKKNTFLSHLLDDNAEREKGKLSRYVNVNNKQSRGVGDVKTFPQEKINSLLMSGFVKKGVSLDSPINQRIDLGNVLITYLLAFGGLRVSEPFHLFLEDVARDENGVAIVKVYHPEEGVMNSKGKKREYRRNYLLKNYGLLPRNDDLCSKGYYAGWKNPVITAEGFFYVNWFPRIAGVEFYELYKLYVETVRMKNTTELDQKGNVIPNSQAVHPFAFVNNSGSPKSYPQYIKQFSKAVENIGLEARKYNGTTPHGLRHSYGKNLSEAGVDGKFITKAMHHSSQDSKLVYTEADHQEVTRAMVLGSEKMLRKVFDGR